MENYVNKKMKKKLMIPLLILITVGAVCANIFLINPIQIKERKEEFSSAKITQKIDGFMIGSFCDLYYGEKTDLDKISNIFDIYGPDMIIFLGDLYEQKPDEGSMEQVRAFLENLNAPYGKYAIKGEHDKEDSINLLQECGFRILDNQNVRIFVDDKNYFNLLAYNSEDKELFNTINTDHFTIGLSHYPDDFDSFVNTDLVLSGHSLGGGFNFPIVSYFTRKEGYEKYAHGKHVKDGSLLDINNGLKQDEKSIRFCADAEIVFYQLKAN